MSDKGSRRTRSHSAASSPSCGTRVLKMSILEVLDLAKDGFIDGIAVMLAGQTEEATRIVHDYAEALHSAGPITVVGSHLENQSGRCGSGQRVPAPMRMISTIPSFRPRRTASTG